MTGGIVLQAQPGPQSLFQKSSADICIFGGAAYGGKTWALLVEPLRHIYNPAFGAVIFRRTYPEITMEGGMWDESETIYPLVGGRPVRGDLYWSFRSGAKVTFAHMQYETDKLSYQGAQIALLCFDQLEHFSDGQFFYMLSRNRSTCGVLPYVRATCNPDPDSWLAAFLSWWIDQETGYAIPERSGVLRWMIQQGGELVWGDTVEQLRQTYGEQVHPKSVTFIPASAYDNKIGMEKDPGYIANLEALPYVERERLLGDRVKGGNWKVRPSAGKVFNRAWFEIVDVIPSGGVEGRGWDFAGTEAKLRGPDPDFTASVKMRRVGGIYYITDCTADQISPVYAEQQLVNLSKQDRALAEQTKTRYLVCWELEPGAAAIRYNRQLVVMLAGLDAAGVPTRGASKAARANPLAKQAMAGNVKLLRAPWNERFLAHMHGQPDLPHDDIMDAAGTVFRQLTESVAQWKAHTL
jgi:predicted phage terminase large subunit-like protein